MKTLPKNNELLEVAKRVVWFQKPKETLDNTLLFAMHTMQYGTLNDLIVFQKYFTKKDIVEVLANTTAGVIGQKSWNFWHYQVGIYNPPPLPIRTIDKTAIPAQTLRHIMTLEKQLSSLK